MIIQSPEMNFNYQMNKMDNLLERANTENNDTKALELLSGALECINDATEFIEQLED